MACQLCRGNERELLGISSHPQALAALATPLSGGRHPHLLFPVSFFVGQRLRGGGETYHVNLGRGTYCKGVWSGRCLFPFKGNDREAPKEGGGDVS